MRTKVSDGDVGSCGDDDLAAYEADAAENAQQRIWDAPRQEWVEQEDLHYLQLHTLPTPAIAMDTYSDGRGCHATSLEQSVLLQRYLHTHCQVEELHLHRSCNQSPSNSSSQLTAKANSSQL